MSHLFDGSKFNDDISEWDISNVIDMDDMFKHSDFNGDISNWNVSSIKYMSFMFHKSNFNQDISDWKVGNKPVDMSYMFSDSLFNKKYI